MLTIHELNLRRILEPASGIAWDSHLLCFVTRPEMHVCLPNLCQRYEWTHSPPDCHQQSVRLQAHFQSESKSQWDAIWNHEFYELFRRASISLKMLDLVSSWHHLVWCRADYLVNSSKPGVLNLRTELSSLVNEFDLTKKFQFHRTIVCSGYCVEGTLAKHVLSEPEDITTMAGQKLPLKLSVDYISFSAHTD